MKFLTSLLAVLCLVFVGCSDTPEEVKDAAVEASVEMDAEVVDQAGVEEAGTEEDASADDAGAEDASVTEDAAPEDAEVDAEQGG